MVLRAYLKETYRGVIEVFEVSDTLRTGFIGCEFRITRRSSILPTNRTLEISDATGLEAPAASAYFQTCSGRRQKKYVKLSLGVFCNSLLPAGLVLGFGPCNDKSEPTSS